MRPRLYWLIVAVSLVGVMLLAVAWQNWTNPVQEVSDLYLRYADDPDVEASFVKGFRINDTLAIDATLLRAKDSSGWERLTEELEIPKATEDVIDGMKKGQNLIMNYLNKKGSTEHCMDTNLSNNDLVGVSHQKHTISIFHIHTMGELKAIITYHTDISTKKTNL